MEGVSTRRIKEIADAPCGTSFFMSLVSTLASQPESELEAWRAGRLDAEAYPHVLADARYEKARIGHRIVSQGSWWSRQCPRTASGDGGHHGGRHRERVDLTRVVSFLEGTGSGQGRAERRLPITSRGA